MRGAATVADPSQTRVRPGELSPRGLATMAVGAVLLAALIALPGLGSSRPRQVRGQGFCTVDGSG